MQCPHCLQHFHAGWHTGPLFLDSINSAADIEGTWGVSVAKCAACGRIIVLFGTLDASAGYWVLNDGARIIRPKTTSRSPVPLQVPAEFATEYSEACLVLPDSEKASAALSRRCLQHLLHEKLGIKERNLSDEIQKLLDSKQLPHYLADELDAIRNIGNFAAHPIKSTNTGEIVDVEPHEAEWLLNLLESLFDFYFVQPEKAKARQDALNAKLQAAGKPPMKRP